MKYSAIRFASVIIVFCAAAASLAAADIVPSTPEKAIRGFYMAYCQLIDPSIPEATATDLQNKAEKRFVTARLVKEIKKYYADNPAADGDFYTQSSGDDLKSIKEVVITNLSGGANRKTADVTLRLADGSLELKVTVVKEKNVWKIDGVGAR